MVRKTIDLTEDNKCCFAVKDNEKEVRSHVARLIKVSLIYNIMNPRPIVAPRGK